MRLFSVITITLTSTLMLHAQNFKVEVTTEPTADGQMLVMKPISHGQSPVLSEAVIKKGKCVLKGKLPANDTICVELSVKEAYGYTNIVIVPNINTVTFFNFTWIWNIVIVLKFFLSAQFHIFFHSVCNIFAI